MRAILHTDIAVNTLAVLTRCTYSKECVKIPPHARISHIFTTAPGIDKAHLFKRICKGAAVISRLTALLPWEDGAMARVARVFACYFEHGYRSQYSCGIDKVHLFERVRKDTATHVIATPEHGI